MSSKNSEKWKCSYKMAHFRLNPARGSDETLNRNLLLPVAKEAANNSNNEVMITDWSLYQSVFAWMDNNVGGGELLDEKWCVYPQGSF